MISIFRDSAVKLPLLATLFCVSMAGWGSDPASGPVLFNRDIRPILSDRCYACHGPDKANRKTTMHFDSKERARTPLASGGLAFVGGDLTKSVMYQRITSDDEAFRMPPASMGYAKLSAQQIDLIKRWIEQGAHMSIRGHPPGAADRRASAGARSHKATGVDVATGIPAP